ncbi:hypothetical protein C817_01146 [Dorea sp. 5-2]|nr:hypothetical protein C817_01146 [Dorea sp. 5-2]
MSINRSKNKPKDIFDDDFEVIYQEDHYSKLLRKELARRNQDYDDHGGYDNGYGRNDDDHDNYDDAYDDDYDDYGDDYDDYSDNDDYNDYSDDYNDGYDDYDDGYDSYDDGYNGYDDGYDSYDDGYDSYDDYDDYDDGYDSYDDYDDGYDDYDNYNDYHSRDNYNRNNRRGNGYRYADRRQNNRRDRLTLAFPAARSVKTGGRIICKLVNLLLRSAALILTAIIIYTLTMNFWKNHSAYGSLFQVFTRENYILTAYLAVAGFLLLFELTAFLLILFAGKKTDRRGIRYDTGRGLFSFVFIYAGSYLSFFLNSLIPASPAPLQGIQGALLVYGSMRSALLPLCIAGIISCLIRRFVVR